MTDETQTITGITRPTICIKGCGTTLGAANRSGVCSGCQGNVKYKPGGKHADGKPRQKRAKLIPGLPTRIDHRPQVDALAKYAEPTLADTFRAVTTGLGLDPDEILGDAMRDWLDGVKDKLKPPSKKERKKLDDEYLLRGDAED